MLPFVPGMQQNVRPPKYNFMQNIRHGGRDHMASQLFDDDGEQSRLGITESVSGSRRARGVYCVEFCKIEKAWDTRS